MQKPESKTAPNILNFAHPQGEYERIRNLLREAHAGYLYQKNCSPTSIIGRIRTELGIPLRYNK